jgi:6-phosphogluconolactonase (cycloisomerase 2 family)
MTCTARRLVLGLAVGLLALSWSGASAGAAGGGIQFLGCVTGKLPVNRTPRAPRPGWCVPTQTAVLDAGGSGLDHLKAIAASPDGRSLYVVSSREDSVAALRPKPLGMQECFSGNARLKGPGGRRSCKLFPHAGTEDALTGFNGVHFITVSPDGRSVYTTSDDDSIGTFARDRRSGRLTYKGCITGTNGRDSSARTGACKPIPSATPAFEGIDSGLGGPASLTVSPDNRFVYVAARADAAVSTFVRKSDGSLAFQGCLTGGISGVVVGFHSVCTLLTDAAGNPNATVLRGVNRIVLSPDGTSLYASAPRMASIAEFRRDPASGQLAYLGCITGEFGRAGTPGQACTPIPTAQEAAFDSGMWGIGRLAISRDGRWLYGAATNDSAIDSFSRDPATGALTYAGCLTSDPDLGRELGTGNPCRAPTGGQQAGAALDRPTDLTLSPSGHSLYVAAAKDSAISRLSRSPATGSLTFSSCLTANAAMAQPAGPCTLVSGRGGAHQLGFAGLSSLAIAGGNLFATASGQSAISRFAISR